MRVSIKIFIVLLMSVARLVGADNPFAALPFPKDISFGMSPGDIQKVHPAIRVRDGAGGNGLFGAVEMIPEGNGVMVGYVYHFKEGQLGAIVYSRTSTNMLIDGPTRHFYTKLLSLREPAANVQTARAGQLLTVKHWKKAKSDIDVCLEATSRGTTITFFMPSLIAFAELFPSVAEQTNQVAVLEKSRNSSKVSEKTENRCIDRLSSEAPSHSILVGE